MLCKFTSFLGSFHWPTNDGDLIHLDISYLEVLILFEQWAGHCLLTEINARPHVRAHRPISVSSVPVTEGIEIRQGAALSVVWSGLMGNFLADWVGSCLARLVVVCPGCDIKAWSYFLQGLWKVVTTSASGRYARF